MSSPSLRIPLIRVCLVRLLTIQNFWNFCLISCTGEEIENKNPEFFSGCCEQLQISETTAYAKFKDLADELFKDQENGQRGTCECQV